MNPALPSMMVSNVDEFVIEPNVKLAVRITDKRTKLYQQIRLERKNDKFVKIILREYGGAIFKVKVSLLDGKAILFYPDFSRMNEVEFFVCQVVRKMREVLSVTVSTNSFIVTKTVTPIRMS